MALFQGLANTIVSAIRGGNNNKPSSNSNSTSKSTSTSTTSTNSASTNRRPTPGRGNYGSNRSDSAGAQEPKATTPTPSPTPTPKPTPAPTPKPTITGKLDGVPAGSNSTILAGEHKGETLTPDMITTQKPSAGAGSTDTPSSITPQKTQEKPLSVIIRTTSENKPNRTVTEAMRENMPKVDYSAPKQSDYTPIKQTSNATKTTNKPIYNVPIIGDAILTAESIIWNPDGSLNTDGGLFYSHPGTLTQAEKYNIYDGSGKERQTAGANTIINLVGSAFLPGAGGAVLKGGQIGLRELGKAAGTAATKEAVERGLKDSALIGLNRFGNFATKPLVKTNSGLVRAATTPATIPINAASGVVLADATKDTVEKTTQYGLGIGALTAAGYGLSFGVGGATAHQAQKIVNKADDAIRTKGLVEIRQQPGIDTNRVIYRPVFTSEGLPLGKGQTVKTVEQSFRENRLIPMPYESTFRGEGDNALNELYHTVSAKLPGKDDSIQAWHATPSDIQGDIVVKGSKSEFPGLYVSPRPLSYFSKVEQWSNPHFSLMPFVTQYRAAVSPSFVHISMPKDTQFTKNPAKQTDKPQLHAPLLKEEYEAIILPGTQLRATETRYAIDVNGRKIPVREKVYAGFMDEEELLPKQKKGNSRKSSERYYEKDKDSSMAYGVALNYSGVRKKAYANEESSLKNEGNTLFSFGEDSAKSGYERAFSGLSTGNPLKGGGSAGGGKKGFSFASSIGEEYGTRITPYYPIDDEDKKKDDRRKKASRKVKIDTYFVSRGISDAFDMVGSSLLPKVKKKNVRAKVASEFYEFGDKNTYKMTVHNSKYKSFPLPELKNSKKTRKTTHKRRSKK